MNLNFVIDVCFVSEKTSHTSRSPSPSHLSSFLQLSSPSHLSSSFLQLPAHSHLFRCLLLPSPSYLLVVSYYLLFVTSLVVAFNYLPLLNQCQKKVTSPATSLVFSFNHLPLQLTFTPQHSSYPLQTIPLNL